MRGQLDVIDAAMDDRMERDKVVKTGRKYGFEVPKSDKYHIGSIQKGSTIAAIEYTNNANPAFKDFRKKLVAYVNKYVKVYNMPLPVQDKYWRIPAKYTVSAFFNICDFTDYKLDI